jgi:radical SAM superfamily enzyme YgiQ (UPF0313 family)
MNTVRDIGSYRSFDRYSRAVRDINRVLAGSAGNNGIITGLADYKDRRLSPVRSEDLLRAAEQPERNPFFPWFKARLPELLESSSTSSPPMIGFSLNYLSQALCAFAMIGFVRRELPGVRIILGGGLVTSWMSRDGRPNLFSGLVDHLIAGPGEGPLRALFGIEGADEDHPAPSYGSLPLREYLSPGLILPYSASSGCYWKRCSFCPENAEDTRYSPVPPVRAAADLSRMIRETQPVLLHLLDNALSPALLRALAGNPPGAPWYGFVRFGPDLLDPDYCRALARSGCVMLKLGLESGDQGVLDRLEKGIDLASASRILKNLREAGIATYVYLLFGTPAETPAEARKTLEFVVRHAREITFLNVAIFNMPVCGREAGEYETEQFYEGDLSLYTGFRHPHGWERRHVRHFLDTEFKRHPAISMILKNDPPIFTSNHAPFFWERNSLTVYSSFFRKSTSLI